MTAYARAHVMRNPIITVNAVQYVDQVTKARLVPDTPTQTLRTFGGVIKDVDTTSWTLELAGVQDRGAAGLAAALDAASGTQIPVIIQPKVGTAQDTATCTVVAAPVDFGGEQGAFRVFEATFEVVDQPVFSQSV